MFRRTKGAASYVLLFFVSCVRRRERQHIATPSICLCLFLEARGEDGGKKQKSVRKLCTYRSYLVRYFCCCGGTAARVLTVPWGGSTPVLFRHRVVVHMAGGGACWGSCSSMLRTPLPPSLSLLFAAIGDHQPEESKVFEPGATSRWSYTIPCVPDIIP